MFFFLFLSSKRSWIQHCYSQSVLPSLFSQVFPFLYPQASTLLFTPNFRNDNHTSYRCTLATAGIRQTIHSNFGSSGAIGNISVLNSLLFSASRGLREVDFGKEQENWYQQHEPDTRVGHCALAVAKLAPLEDFEMYTWISVDDLKNVSLHFLMLADDRYLSNMQFSRHSSNTI